MLPKSSNNETDNAFLKLTGNYVGRLSRNVVMTGNVHLNGKKRRLDYGVAVSKVHTKFFDVAFRCQVC